MEEKLADLMKSRRYPIFVNVVKAYSEGILLFPHLADPHVLTKVICLTIHSFTGLQISVCQPAFPSVCLSVSLSVCLSVCLSVSACVRQSVKKY